MNNLSARDVVTYGEVHDELETHPLLLQSVAVGAAESRRGEQEEEGEGRGGTERETKVR